MAPPIAASPQEELVFATGSPTWAMMSAAPVETQPFQAMALPAYQYRLKAVEIPALVQFAETTKATLAHVDTTNTLLNRHVDIYAGLFAGLVQPVKPDGLTLRLRAFLAKWGQGAKDPDTDVVAMQQRLTDGHGAETLTRRMMVSATSTLPPISATGLTASAGSESAAMLALARKGMDDFHELDALRSALARLKRVKLQRVNASLKESARLEREIAAARSEYASLDKQRIAAEEDYTLARGLIEEQLQAVDDAFVERGRLLSSPVALCYVRVNDLPVTIDHRATPLIPRVDPGQLPVACDSVGELPERLTPFLELLADQPMSAWRALAGRWHELPPAWVYQPPAPLLPGYYLAIQALPTAFRGVTKAVPVPMAQRMTAWPATGTKARPPSQATLGRQAAEHITLEQLTKVGNAALRIAARRLHDDLARALACLLDQLLALPAADRFAWSRLAEDDQLAVERPQRWPGFDAHRRTTAGLQLRGIIEWLNAQLADDAPSEALAAVRTTLRACLLQTVNDDPAELLKGDVVQFPGLWHPGVLIGTTLNRVPQLKAPLKVYDNQRRLIGEARVVDSEPQTQASAALVTQVQFQAQVEIITTYVATPASFAGWTVVG